MKQTLGFLFFSILLITLSDFHANAAPSGPLIKHLSSFIKWIRVPPKPPQTDGDLLQFETGYLVETVVEGNKLGVVPHSIRISPEGELFAIDSVNSNVVRITPPLSQYSRARLVAGSFQGYSGHVDGKPSDARFNHPKGFAIDDKGNVYVADTLNMAIRKIGEGGVTTIAGGKSNVAGYRDGPSEDAKFSTDFDVVYLENTCSLLVIDRGNAALRQIALNREDCDYQYSSVTVSGFGPQPGDNCRAALRHWPISRCHVSFCDHEGIFFVCGVVGDRGNIASAMLEILAAASEFSSNDIILVAGAVLVGYVSCLLQQGFGPSLSSKTKQASENEFEHKPSTEKPSFIEESSNENPGVGWPSPWRLISDLFKFMAETLCNFFYFIPFRARRSRKGLTPLKDRLVMPEDKKEPPLVQKHRTSRLASETLHTFDMSNNFTQEKPPKNKPVSLKDPSLSTKHRSSKRQDFTDFYGSSETSQPNQHSSKSQKERTRHRHHDKSREVIFGVVGTEPKPVEIKSVDYGDPKFDHYNIRSKFGMDDLFHF